MSWVIQTLFGFHGEWQVVIVIVAVIVVVAIANAIAAAAVVAIARDEDADRNHWKGERTRCNSSSKHSSGVTKGTGQRGVVTFHRAQQVRGAEIKLPRQKYFMTNDCKTEFDKVDKVWYRQMNEQQPVAAKNFC